MSPDNVSISSLILRMKLFRNFSKAVCALLLPCALTACHSQSKTGAAEDTAAPAQAVSVRFDADSAFAVLRAQCEFGARVPGSEAHRLCGDYIAALFRSRGLDVTEQQAEVTAWDGKRLNCRNIIAAYRPELKDRVLICAHWDSRPWADADPDSTRHREPVMAANDGASGVAVMAEVARLLHELKPAVGVDFVCFDVEDYGAPYWAQDRAPEDGSDWCLGSQYWARHPHRADYSALYGILLDMVGGDDARFCYEGFSLQYARDVVMFVWQAAEVAGAGKYFLREDGGWAQDDHKPINEQAGIPTVDIIPFLKDGEHSFSRTWHTTYDTPENISPETLAAVGQTLLQVLGSTTASH